MRKYIARYVDPCDTCSRIKPVRHVTFGLLKRITPPARRWSSLSMDFVTARAESNAFNAILVEVDGLSKMAQDILCRDTATAQDVAQLYVTHIWKLHGISESIVSDRGTTFTSLLWKSLCSALKVQAKFSTTFHPQTDGPTE